MKKFMKWTGILLGGLIGLTLLAGLALYPVGLRKLNRTYPGIQVEAVNIPSDPDTIDRGEHIAIIWKCTTCHGEDLSGMLLSDDPLLGTIPASNLTSGDGGIAGSYIDADWVRAIRHGVKPNSRAALFMYDYSTMSDQDLGALIAYLKQIPPVDAEYPAMRYGPILPIAPAIGLLTPAAEGIDHNASHPADPAPGATVAYGKYLSTICAECHGTSLGDKLKGWEQKDFIRAIQTAVRPDGESFSSSAHLKTFSQMNDTELSALWLYFQSLPSQE
ncbi:MAG: cytochrome c [Chloroflexi bacterium]|nr:MAG: cytochrome c [Chloroflexota bacterium]